MYKKVQTSRGSGATHSGARPLGAPKAIRFSLVEGLTLSAASETTLARLKARGLAGEELRSAIAETFRKKRGA